MRHRRLSSSWMRGVRGCFVCGRDHLAREKHKPHEVSAAIERLKKRHPKALITVTDMAYVVDLFNDEDANVDDEVQAEWASGDSDKGDNETEGDSAYIAETDYGSIAQVLSNSAFLHGLSIGGSKSDALRAMSVMLNANSSENTFNGIKIDTCCNRKSVISLAQYKAYCRLFGLKEHITRANNLSLEGIGGSRTPIGTANIQVPFRKLGLIIDLDLLVLEENVPTLLSMKDMVDNGLDISIQEKRISCGGRIQALKMENYFLVHHWKPDDLPFALYSEADLRVIHKSFGHPSIGATEGLLKRASGGSITRELREKIGQIAESCKICKTYAGAPRRFKLTVGADELRFNHTVQVDTMFLLNKPVLHMVDLATHFCAAVFLKSQSSSEIWRAIRTNWNLVYLGPPDYLWVDQGSAYISREMRENLEASGISLKEAPIESPGTIGTVERYHAPLRAAFLKIRADLDRSTSDAECLRCAVFAVNSTIGPEGLCPMLLVFGTIPRPARCSISATQIQRSKAIDEAATSVEKEQSKSRIAFGLRHKMGPRAVEMSERLRDLPAGSDVLVWRPKSKRWEGPSTLINVNGETAVIQTGAGRRIFRTTCVKPYVKANWHQQTEDGNEQNGGLDEISNGAYETKTGKKDINKHSRNSKKAVEFMKSRAEELQGLLSNGTFVPVDRSEISPHVRVFGSRFVDELKKGEHGLRRKSRLIAQNYEDKEAEAIATRAPTVQRASQRLLLSLASSTRTTTLFSRDVTQAYIQSVHDLDRNVYIAAPAEMKLPPDTVLKVVRPLYGIPESGLLWYLTYLDHHLNVLKMKRSTADPCLLYKRDENGTDIEGIVILQVDDTLGIGSDRFLHDEEEAAKRFKCKPRKILDDKPTSFNGSDIRRDNLGCISMRQDNKIDKLIIPSTQKDFNSQRALAQYIGVNTRPDVCASIQLIAPGSEPTTQDEMKHFEKAVKHLRQTKEVGLTFNALDMSTASVLVVTDASFANARGLKSQLGFMVLLVDDAGRCNIIHYSSARCPRVTRSVMAAEIHALVLGCDHAFVLHHLLEEILGRKIRLEAMVDSKTVFDVIAKDSKTAEKRLQIDIAALREAYANGDFSRMGWIPGSMNPADALTKRSIGTRSPLWSLMTEGIFQVKATGSAVVTNKTEIA